MIIMVTKSKEILISSKLFVFEKVLEKFGIAKKVAVTKGNRMVVDALRLTVRSDDEDVIGVFRFMWERAKIMKPSVRFDPLGLFENN